MILRLARLIAIAHKANNIARFLLDGQTSRVLGSDPGGPSPVSSLLAQEALSRGSRAGGDGRGGGHDEGLVVLVVLEVDLVHRPRHHDGDVVVPPLQQRKGSTCMNPAYLSASPRPPQQEIHMNQTLNQTKTTPLPGRASPARSRAARTFLPAAECRPPCRRSACTPCGRVRKERVIYRVRLKGVAVC